MENVVFIAHRRLGRKLYYYRTRSGREIDFVWRRRDGTLEFIQVAETAPNDSSIRERELSALREALQEHPESTAILVTKDDERETISLDNGVVESIPVWRYLLEEEIGS